MYDFIIKNGQVADGESDSLIKADVAVNGDKIVAVAPDMEPDNASKIIDADGKVVAPGFVDVHSHSDYYLIIDPRAESKIMQGVTTEIGGNCGYCAAPMSGKLRDRRAADYEKQFGIKVDWSDLTSYFTALGRKGHAVNFAALLGYNTIRGSALGENSNQPDANGIKKLREMTAKGLDQGALGMSVGVVYPPACFAGLEEFTEVFKVVADRGKVFTSHIRSEGAGLLDALKEVVAVAKNSGAKLQVSHLKTAGSDNWGKLGAAFDILESAMADGVSVKADRYPYLASNTGLQVVLPDRAFDDGRAKLVERLKDKGSREAFKREILKAHPEKKYWDTVMVSQVVTDKNKDIEGLTVSEGADKRGKDIFDFVFDLLAEENTDVEAIFFCMNEDNLDTIMAKPWVTIGSDSGARAIDGPLAIGRPHPRTFGTFPRFFAEFVREKKLFTIGQAVKKTSSDALNFFGVSQRGYIKEGFFADIVVFDPATIGDTSTYLEPLSYPAGIEHVFVNGSHAVENGAPCGVRGGRVIRR
ncbi:N-acyl-D-amino-acid deacylase [hydrothermal vent metagenome]|uniref:N-acyl-D-amino-acid deacylase n=1 Tax=hydrothermal vent metagenome TaxID=652676 RepID=A0A3B1BGZ5_9ZZZZ